MRNQVVSLLLCIGLLMLSCPLSAQTLISRQSRYQLHPGDVITVEYRYTPEYNAAVAIQPDGFTTLPFLGELKLGGLSIPQAKELLVAEAGKRLNDPEITVGVKGFENPYYTVSGEVGTPGRYEMHGPMTALRAIQIAGGFKVSGKTSQIVLIRPVSETSGETRLIDLKKAMQKHQRVEEIEIRDGDMLIVPRTRFAKIEPYVRLVSSGFYLSPSSF